MSNERNQPCPCGSGKKYKKCCLNKTTQIISNKLEQTLGEVSWFHGTEQKFSSWIFPPPKKPDQDLLLQHTAVFFTTNLEFAKGAGQNIASVSLSKSCKILDTRTNYKDSELLRKKVKENAIASLILNTEHDYWHNGWISGDVLRMAFNNEKNSQIYMQHASSQLKGLNIQLTDEEEDELIALNSSRGLIELICISAKELGYDAIFGHEVDRHSTENKVIAQPWLAVLSEKVISEPIWI